MQRKNNNLRGSTPDSEINPEWTEYNDGKLLIQKDLFPLGILAVQPNSLDEKKFPVGVNGFSIGVPTPDNFTEQSRKGRQLAFFQDPNAASPHVLDKAKKEALNAAKKQRELLSKLVRFQEPKIYIQGTKNFILNLLTKGNLPPEYIGSYIFTKKPVGLLHIKLEAESSNPVIEELKVEDNAIFNDIVTEIGQYDPALPIQESPKKQLQVEKLWKLISKNPGHKYEEPEGLSPELERFIFNRERHDELFHPFILDENVGSYIYPSVSSKNTAMKNFTGFHTFHLCGCLFGAGGLTGIDNFGGVVNIIKHDIQFFDKQKIEGIDYNPKAPSSYEISLFHELEKSAKFIDRFSARGKTKEMAFHIPHYDYMLFAINLFLRGRISFSALDAFFNAICQKAQNYVKKITAICKQHHIQVTITSPFENIFGPFPVGPSIDEATKKRKENEKEKSKTFAHSILEKLKLSSEEVDPSIDEATKKRKENELVQLCLSMLINNHYNEDQREVWEDFINVEGANNINSLEDLFKIANAVMIGITAKGKKDHATCSILPISEKQIIVSYEAYTNLRKRIEKCNSEIKAAEKNVEEKTKIFKIAVNNLANEEKQPEVEENLDQIHKVKLEISASKRKADLHKAELARLVSLEKVMEKYPAIFNCIGMEPVLIYDKLTKGPQYYSSQESSGYASKLFCKDSILDHVGKNIRLFAQGKTSLTIEDVVDQKRLTLKSRN